VGATPYILEFIAADNECRELRLRRDVFDLADGDFTEADLGGFVMRIRLEEASISILLNFTDFVSVFADFAEQGDWLDFEIVEPVHLPVFHLSSSFRG